MLYYKLYPKLIGNIINIKDYYKDLVDKLPPNSNTNILLNNNKNIGLIYSLDNGSWLNNVNCFANNYISIKDKIFGINSIKQVFNI